MTLDAQRMIDGAGGYTITGISADTGITAAPVSGQFGSDGSAAATVAITVAPSVPEEYYLVYLTTTVGASTRSSVVLVVVQDTRPTNLNSPVRPFRYRSASASPASR